MIKNQKLIPILFLVTFISFYSFCSWGQKKRIDLDDLMIKGQLHNDDRLLILSRQKNELKNYIKFRTNFRSEILQQQVVRKYKKKNY